MLELDGFALLPTEPELLLTAKGVVIGPHSDSREYVRDQGLAENWLITGLQELPSLSQTSSLPCLSNVACKECNEINKGDHAHAFLWLWSKAPPTCF